MDIPPITAYYLTEQFGAGQKKWTTLNHNGVVFSPPYTPHKVPILYNGNQIELEPDNEELATIYAKFTDTEYIKDHTFKKNFWNDFKKMLGKEHIIQSLDNCDFSLIYDYLLKEKERKKVEGNSIKEDVEKYKVAYIDGKPQPVGNFRMEPPGIFLGRGCNKRLGMIKKRILPEDITINIGKGETIPELPDFFKETGHKWGEIIHNPYVEWLASWQDTITGKLKYVWLGSHSDQKAKSDIEKFDLARKLKKKIKTIRLKNEIELKSDDKKMRQIATAFYFIDKYALRVGNEKGEGETDTVGVTSLRVEHIELLEGGKVKLDFLGKDSVRYMNTVHVDDIVYTNLKTFIEGKDLDDQLFDMINSSDVNAYLKTYMKNLTAKVFRTYNASYIFQKELSKVTNKYDNYEEVDKINLLLDEFNRANMSAAKICNHQKNVNKSNVKQIDTINKQIKTMKARIRKEKKNKKNPEKIKELQTKLKKLRAKKEIKIEMKNLSLSTSKVNYIDPRITVAFLKTHNIPVDKIFPKTLQEKFKWAFDIDESYKF
jgi:DNA topoisomerase-1